MCDTCHTDKEERHFGGHKTCYDCRRQHGQLPRSINVQLAPKCDAPLFDYSDSSHSCLSFMERAAIATMDKLGFSQEDIVRWIGHDRRTVNLSICHFEQNGSVEDLPKSGRQRESTAEDDERIVALVEREKFITPKRIRSEL